MTTTAHRSALRRTTALAAAAVVGTWGLTACTDAEPDPSGSRGIDARAYVEDYEEGADQDRVYSSSPTTGSLDRSAGETEIEVPTPIEDNTFVDAGVSDFVDTERDALSTFALDVDTGSFGVARTLLGDGFLPPPASIRVEEWVNAMTYDDPAPEDADLGLTAESGVAPTLPEGIEVVRVGVSARELDPEQRPRMNVTLVVDRSGSMDIRNRLGLVQSSLALLADRLADDDTVSVVSFEDQAMPLLEPTLVAETDKILDAIDKLEPGGSTNLEAGLELGYEQARKSFDESGVNIVVLASDGVANVGATGAGSITERIAEEGADGIHLVTVGYGMGNYNDHLMEQLANLGDGFYSYVDTFDEAEQLFGEDLSTTLTPVAGEARAQVEFDSERVASYRLIGYDNRDLADQDFEDMDVDAGELGAGHHATALYEVELAEGVTPGDVIGTTTVQWRSVDRNRTERATTDVVAADPGATPSEALALSTTVADLAQVLKGAPSYAERGVELEDILERARSLVASDVTGAGELVDLVELAMAAR